MQTSFAFTLVFFSLKNSRRQILQSQDTFRFPLRMFDIKTTTIPTLDRILQTHKRVPSDRYSIGWWEKDIFVSQSHGTENKKEGIYSMHVRRMIFYSIFLYDVCATRSSYKKKKEDENTVIRER